MSRYVQLGNRQVGEGHPAYIIGEIGINHNGDIEVAKKLIDAAALAGCDAVKFQKRTPELCVPENQRSVIRETPWGLITYMQYRERVEFGKAEYAAIDRHARERNLHWFASPWDEPSLDFMLEFDVPCIKIASASLTDDALLRKARDSKKVVILSTGMSTTEQIDHALEVIGTEQLILLHATSTYPCPPEQLNLSCIPVLLEKYPELVIGYSGHETGLQTTVAAFVLGAKVIERHITLDRAMWGSDQAASIEPQGLIRLVRDIRTIEKALGDGKKIIYDSELSMIERLRNRP